MKTQQGFTLIELAIVLVIVTLLVGGLAMPLSAQIEARRISETRKTLEEAREAILGYAMSHTIPSTCTCVYQPDTTLDVETVITPEVSTCPASLCPTTGTVTLTLPITRHYLPCPDVNSDPKPAVDNDGDGIQNDANNGREDRDLVTGDCLASSGNLPWVTLATAGQDAWGNRLHYALTSPYGNKLVGFNNGDDGNNQICSRSVSPGCTTGLVADKVPAVIVSYGPNGWGARNINNSAVTRAAPTSADELENTDADAIYVSRSPTRSDVAIGEFDDLLVWISKEILISRVCPAPGGCP